MPQRVKHGGRKKGTPNRKTTEAISRAERILSLIERKYFEKDIEALTSSQRMILYSDMLEYVAPKLSRQEVTGEGGKAQKFEITLKI